MIEEPLKNETYAQIKLTKKLLLELKGYEKNNKILWKDIKGYEGVYQISNVGLVKSLSRVLDNGKGGLYKSKEIILKLSIDRGGYANVSLCKNGKIKKIGIHRLVGLNFILNKDNKREVNHIDGDKLNNNLENLEWCTASENIRHRFDKLGYKSRMQTDGGPSKGKFGRLNHKSKEVLQLDLSGRLIRVWDSTMDIQRELGILACGISNCCHGRLKTSGGFTWKYI